MVPWGIQGSCKHFKHFHSGWVTPSLAVLPIFEGVSPLWPCPPSLTVLPISDGSLHLWWLPHLWALLLRLVYCIVIVECNLQWKYFMGIFLSSLVLNLAHILCVHGDDGGAVISNIRMTFDFNLIIIVTFSKGVISYSDLSCGSSKNPFMSSSAHIISKIQDIFFLPLYFLFSLFCKLYSIWRNIICFEQQDVMPNR